MELSQQALDEFKQIYLAESGEAITDAEAREMGTRLLRVFRIFLDVSDAEQETGHDSGESPTDLSTVRTS